MYVKDDIRSIIGIFINNSLVPCIKLIALGQILFVYVKIMNGLACALCIPVIGIRALEVLDSAAEQAEHIVIGYLYGLARIDIHYFYTHKITFQNLIVFPDNIGTVILFLRHLYPEDIKIRGPHERSAYHGSIVDFQITVLFYHVPQAMLEHPSPVWIEIGIQHQHIILEEQIRILLRELLCRALIQMS